MIELPSDLDRRITDTAEESGKSFGAVVREVLKQHFADYPTAADGEQFKISREPSH